MTLETPFDNSFPENGHDTFMLRTTYLECDWELNNYFGKLYCASIL